MRLEAIKSVGMPFCFKGGTSLMLILDKPARLSTDIDILVEPETDVDGYIEKASRIFPFLNKKEDIRKGKNEIVKRHFRFTYFSPPQEYGILYSAGCGLRSSSLCQNHPERNPQ